MRIHLIAIGGSVMHNLAIALKKGGHQVSGSDDEIYEPSKSLLQSHGLLPAATGWDPERITPSLDLVILGMHARADNTELLAAVEAQIPVQSFPEFIAAQAREQKRVVIAGSHGKTTTCSMVMHALRYHNYNFDYLVGARLEGFDTMVSLSDAPVTIIEGDEYLSSTLDSRPKFLHYKPHYAVITGIAWDHMNVFPEYSMYLKQFAEFIRTMDFGSVLYYFDGDRDLKSLVNKHGKHLQLKPYHALSNVTSGNDFAIQLDRKLYPVPFFGSHNFQNCSAAMGICGELGMTEKDFLEAIQSFKGASKRLEKLMDSERITAYRDFAHAPSKLKATIQAVREKFPRRQLIAVYELHTFSSLNKNFLPQYSGSMAAADTAIIYYNPETVEKKKLPALSKEEVSSAFGSQNAKILDNLQDLTNEVRGMNSEEKVFLWMSSGHFDGLQILPLMEELSRKNISE